VAASVRAAAQVALQPLIRRTHDHLSALAVRRTTSRKYFISTLEQPEATTYLSLRIHPI
jgi:hypothetical protein